MTRDIKRKSNRIKKKLVEDTGLIEDTVVDKDGKMIEKKEQTGDNQMSKSDDEDIAPQSGAMKNAADNKKNRNLLIYLLAISILTAVLALGLCLYLYKLSLEQNEKILNLTERIEALPKPISQGRLELTINKYQKDVEIELMRKFERIVSDNTRALEQKINSIPAPLSLGKIGLIISKEVKKPTDQINKKINDVKLEFSKFEEKINSLPTPLSPGRIGLIVSSESKKLFSTLDKRLTELSKLRNTSIESQKIDVEEYFNKLEEKLLILEKKLFDNSNDVNQINIENYIATEINKMKIMFLNEIEKLRVTKQDTSDNSFFVDRKQTGSFTELSDTFSDAAHEAIKANIMSNSDPGFISFIWAKLKVIFAQRSLTPQQGTSVDAILSRAEAALQKGDVNKALSEIDTLPEAAREAMFDWSEFARKLLLG